jgi:hypothetical protein
LATGRLRALVAPQPVSDSMRAHLLAEVGIRRGADLRQLLLVAALILLLIAALAIRAGSTPPSPLPMGFGGAWTTTNCAMWWAGGEQPAVDCDRWGDGTTIELSIGHGEPASIRVSSAPVPDCVGSASVNITPPMVRDGTFLWVEVEGTPCARLELGDDSASHLYLEPGDQRIWFDDDGDGWGLFWTRRGSSPPTVPIPPSRPGPQETDL